MQRFSMGGLLCAVVLCQASAAAAQSCSLVVAVTGLRSTQGQVLVALHNAAKGFPGQGALRRALATWQGSAATCTFDQLPPGTYALAVVHDENGDGRFNTNWMGIPKEGYAASNNAKGFMGPPSYKDAAFVVQGAVTQHTLAIQY